MTEAEANPLPRLLQHFFQKHLLVERQLSNSTVRSYRDTFRLLINFIQERTQRAGSQQRLDDWDAPLILDFLDHLETRRGCSARSRNARLAAIHTFMRYVCRNRPDFLELGGRVLAIPNKRHSQSLVGYLSAEELRAILKAPDPASPNGRRDRLLFQLLYDTGARVSEIVALNREALNLADSPQTVSFWGKGRKQRVIPLQAETVRQLRRWLDRNCPEPSSPLFVNRFGNRLSRFGIHKRLNQAAQQAARKCSSLRRRKVFPHLIRHTTAMRMLQSGIDITSISLWLGHESPLTTHQYVEADLEMKQKILGSLEEPNATSAVFRPKDSLLAFLEAL